MFTLTFVCFPSCNYSVESIEKSYGPQRQCYKGKDGEYQLESCGPVDDYVCVKYEVNDEVGHDCSSLPLAEGRAIGTCSENFGIFSCHCDTDGWVHKKLFRKFGVPI